MGDLVESDLAVLDQRVGMHLADGYVDVRAGRPDRIVHDIDNSAAEFDASWARRKTESDNAVRLIHTVRGVGYVMRETPP